MSDRSLIFSAPMVRALAFRRKTMTRRVLRPQPIKPELWCGTWVDAHREQFAGADDGERAITPWQAGDRIWVREAWRTNHEFDRCAPRDIPSYADIWYDADHVLPYGAKTASGRARSPIHLPRWASRLTLYVTAVRVDRLHDITEADAIAEGCEETSRDNNGNCWHEFAREEYRRLWNSLHGPDAWSLNPWVAAITFTVRRANVDEVAK